ncbi:type II toxin-antitoxin system RelE/ParE family toxin [Candidatus Pacearchaeota archaeon]|nr:type II toxin-antitoxin system RelE/ParE family toxin [Candidatus Pacearchaeota archaeon]
MNYSVQVDKKAQGFLDKLPQDIALRIVNKLEQIKENPFHFLEHYEGEYYKLRIGDYRALMDIDFQRKIIWVRVIDKRGRIYKR